MESLSENIASYVDWPHSEDRARVNILKLASKGFFFQTQGTGERVICRHCETSLCISDDIGSRVGSASCEPRDGNLTLGDVIQMFNKPTFIPPEVQDVSTLMGLTNCDSK